MNYTHLTQTERYQIYTLNKIAMTTQAIAAQLNRHPSTIARELKRGTGGCGYRPSQAQRLADHRALLSRNQTRLSNTVMTQAIDKLKLYWSPEQIAARLPISHETLYQHLYQNKREGGSLCQYLRCQKPRRKRYGVYDRRTTGGIPNRVDISLRPAYVEQRATIGHWEADTIIGRGHHQAIVSVVERKSGFTVIQHVKRKQAVLVSEAIQTQLQPYAARVKSITFDNGREFTGHGAIATALAAKTYFARPYASWQRGTNENTNGLIRQFFPKSRHFSTITEDEIKQAAHRLNHRPRKRLNYKTPYEVFMNSFNRVALRA